MTIQTLANTQICGWLQLQDSYKTGNGAGTGFFPGFATRPWNPGSGYPDEYPEFFLFVNESKMAGVKYSYWKKTVKFRVWKFSRPGSGFWNFCPDSGFHFKIFCPDSGFHFKIFSAEPGPRPSLVLNAERTLPFLVIDYDSYYSV